jgi:hypothetical protein
VVTAADVALTLPGDELIPDAAVVMDRVLHLPAAPAQVWPWLVQLGKRRAGWYFPRLGEHMIPRGRRASWTIDSRWQGAVVGDRIPDWGPGNPSFEAVAVDPPTALVYLSLRQKSRGHGWPDPGHEDDADVRAFSWALVLSPSVGSEVGTTRVHIRLRVRRSARPRRPWSPLVVAAGRAIDWGTIRLLERGLSQRLKKVFADQA